MSDVQSTTRGSGFHADPKTGICYRTLDFMEFSGYRVGDNGSIWSRKKQVGHKGEWKKGLRTVLGNKWRKLKPSTVLGYRQIMLMRDGKASQLKVHRLVLMAFVGIPAKGMEACHFPERDPTCNRLANLRWDTPKGNQADAARHGTRQNGVKNYGAKLSENDVRTIRDEVARKITTISAAAKKYHVDYATVRAIVIRKTWKHII